LLVFVTALIVITNTVTGCETAANNKPANKVSTSKAVAEQLTTSKVIADIRSAEKGHTVSDIHIIGVKNFDGQGAGFASFNLDGHLKYASVTDSKTQGMTTGILTPNQTKRAPIQYTQTVSENGYSSITGFVDSNADIKTVVITFSRGQIREIPVIHGVFWFFGKVGTSEKDTYSKGVIGVTSDGNIVTNSS
jgi:hypothetical protein